MVHATTILDRRGASYRDFLRMNVCSSPRAPRASARVGKEPGGRLRVDAKTPSSSSNKRGLQRRHAPGLLRGGLMRF